MKATIIGNLGKDSEAFTSKSGKSGLKFSLADNVGYGDNKKTQWVNCTLWGERGGKLSALLKKGVKVVVFGEVAIRDYQDSNGCAKYSLDCNVADVVLVGGGERPAPAPGDVSTDDIPF